MATTTESRRDARKSMVLNSRKNSLLKSMLLNKEYTRIHRSINAMDPRVTNQVIHVQLNQSVRMIRYERCENAYYDVLRPTNRFAAKIAATDTVVPKSAKDSMGFPVQDVALPVCHMKKEVK